MRQDTKNKGRERRTDGEKVGPVFREVVLGNEGQGLAELLLWLGRGSEHQRNDDALHSNTVRLVNLAHIILSLRPRGKRHVRFNRSGKRGTGSPYQLPVPPDIVLEQNSRSSLDVDIRVDLHQLEHQQRVVLIPLLLG